MRVEGRGGLTGQLAGTPLVFPSCLWLWRGGGRVEGPARCSCKVHENVAHSRAWTARIPHTQSVGKGEVGYTYCSSEESDCINVLGSDGGRCGRCPAAPYLEAATRCWHLSATPADGRLGSGLEVTDNPIHSNVATSLPLFFSGWLTVPGHPLPYLENPLPFLAI